MRPQRHFLASGCAFLLISLIAGCSEQKSETQTKKGAGAAAAKPSTPAKKEESQSKPETAVAAKSTGEKMVAKPAAAPAKAEPEKKPAEQKPVTPEKTPEKTAAVEKPAAKPVMLGTSEPVSGIPGDGPLGVEEIKKWLAQPGVHDPIAVELPLGLSLGQGQIKGLDKNPLTRAKIELGRQLYFDTRLSADNTISCSSCHSPDEGWTRSTQFGVGIKGQTGNRNSPVSFNRILSDLQFWDGRAASLEDQAVGPIQNPIEMGNTHEKAVAAVKGIEGYRVEFEAVFGSEGVTIGNIGKAIATFERTVVTSPSAYDFYEPLRNFQKSYSKEDLANLKTDDPDLFVKYEAARKASEAHPMSESAIRGRELFFTEKGNCSTCHVGANLSDEKYHNLGVGMDKAEPDLGRFAVTKDEKDKGAFKTPTVRNIAQTGPYMHDGSQKSLEEVVEWYDKGGHPNPHLSDKIKKLNLTAQDKKDLVEFLKACTGEFPKVATGRLPK